MKECSRVFYVYEWFNKDTGEVFYVGKGKGYRSTNKTQRNRYFKNYFNKYDCEVRKIAIDLSEEESFKLETEKILEYKEKGQCKCNLAIGGGGVTFEEGTEHWYKQKLKAYERIDSFINTKVSEYVRLAEYETGVDVGINDMTLDELKLVWEKFLEIKYDSESDQEAMDTIYEMIYSDPGFEDVWEGLC